MAIQSYSIHFEHSIKLSPRVEHFVFSTNHEKLTQFIPGQFITLLIECEGKTLRRSYSLANQSQNGKIEFAASYVANGIASELLFNLEPNTEIQAQGPFGRLILNDNDKGKRLVLVGTSTGITPYLAMLDQLSHRLEANELSEELLYEEAFLSFAETSPSAHFCAALSQEKDGGNSAAHHHHGRVQVVLETLQLSPDKDVIYLCGNPQMIDDVFENLKAKGFETKNIRREKYISR